ncbi:ribulose-phosphate 3-epimerase [Thermosipho atlanticus]|uniref:Ribulose-phosphate 3-epimerase n=1 Tax=Thermosipho atlanticus DSM 15807 TaxID=1123380 RepID=A0A1M5R3Q2_9BACT|nr:ribulose-phosphate 3-epimerase [Thermosipho atlanticus]SHH20831.1 ribulose-5-phosphate 3-epimerase [Thermosipho atlanticus DSM 15807]
MVKFSASILGANLTNLEAEIKRVQPYIDEIHLDIMDGHFVPNLTFAYPVLDAVKRCTNLPIDAHLMVTNPEFHIPKLLTIGVDRITIHIESTVHINKLISQVKETDTEIFVTLNPGTPLSAIEEVLSDVDGILVMSVNPGFSGQKFIAKSLEKIKKLKEWKLKYGMDYYIAVDGGINNENIQTVINAGANILIMGYGIFKNDNLENLSRTYRK